MKSFVSLLEGLLIVGLAVRLLPGTMTFALIEVAFLAVYLVHGHRTAVRASEASIKATFDAEPGHEQARRLMRDAGYNV